MSIRKRIEGIWKGHNPFAYYSLCWRCEGEWVIGPNVCDKCDARITEIIFDAALRGHKLEHPDAAFRKHRNN